MITLSVSCSMRTAMQCGGVPSSQVQTCHFSFISALDIVSGFRFSAREEIKQIYNICSLVYRQ